MAFSVVRLTAQRLAAFTPADLSAFAARVPPEDRCMFGGKFPDGATWLRYASDQTKNLDTGQNETQGLFAGVTVDEASAIYAAALFRDLGGGVFYCAGWFSPIDGRTFEALSAVEDFLAARGVTAVEGSVTNARLRNRMLGHAKISVVRGLRLRYTF